MKFQSKSQQGQGSEKYLRIKDGETVKVVFRGEIAEHYIKWENGKSVNVSGITPGAKLRFTVNVVVPSEAGTFVAKVFEFGYSIYQQLEMLNKTYGDVTLMKVALARKGQKLDTTYMLMPLPHELLSQAQLDKINAVTLNILNAGQESEVPTAGTLDLPDWGEPLPNGEPPF